MTLTINLAPELVRALEEKAKGTGLSVPEFAAALLAQATREDSSKQLADIPARLTALERLGSYDTRLRAGLPPLSDQDIARESIYEGRGL